MEAKDKKILFFDIDGTSCDPNGRQCGSKWHPGYYAGLFKITGGRHIIWKQKIKKYFFLILMEHF